MVAMRGNYREINGFCLGTNSTDTLIYLVKGNGNSIKIKNYLGGPVVMNCFQNSNGKISVIEWKKNMAVFKTLDLEVLVKNNEKTPEIKN